MKTSNLLQQTKQNKTKQTKSQKAPYNNDPIINSNDFLPFVSSSYVHRILNFSVRFIIFCLLYLNIILV